MNSMPLDQNQEIHNSTTDYLQSIYEHLVQKLQPELRTLIDQWESKKTIIKVIILPIM